MMNEIDGRKNIDHFPPDKRERFLMQLTDEDETLRMEEIGRQKDEGSVIKR